MNDLKKTLLLIQLQLLRIFRQIKTLLAVLVFCFLIVNLFLLVRNSTETPVQTIALVVEDDSLEVKTFLNNITDNRLKNIFAFQYMTLSDALDAVENRNIVGALHIPKGLFSSLDQGKQQSLSLYLSDENEPLSRFLIQYVDNLTQVLNESQVGAMVYLREMRRSDLSVSDVRQRFSNIQVEYVTAFLTRNKVFEDTKAIDLFSGTSFVSYYFFSAVLFLTFFFAFTVLMLFKDDLNSKRWQRLRLSGHSLPSLYFSMLVSTALPIILTLFALDIIHHFFLYGELSSFVPLSSAARATLVSLLISFLTIVLIRYTASSRFFDWIYAIALSVTALSGGLLLPLPAMGSFFVRLALLHPIAHAHRFLSGGNFSALSLLSFSITFFTMSILLFWKERRCH